MIIRKLKLLNYRRFIQLELEFPENLIGIIGRNGSGKTTIIEAIAWALYGTRATRTEKGDIRSQNAAENDICTAELEFYYGGHEYRVERRLKGKNALAEAMVYRAGNTEPEAVREKGVNDFIEALLQLDYRSFFASVFARQKDLASLSAMKPEERRKSINRLINIDRIDWARQQISKDKREKSKYLDGLERNAPKINELDTEKQRLSAEKSKYDQEIKKLKKGLFILEKKLAAARSCFKEQNKIRDQHLNLESHTKHLDDQIKDHRQQLQRNINDRNEIAAAQKELHELEPRRKQLQSVREKKESMDRAAVEKATLEGKNRELKQLNALLQNEKKQQDKLNNRIADLGPLEKSLKMMEKKLEQNEQSIVKQAERVKKNHAQLQVVKGKGIDLKSRIEHIQTAGPNGTCPVCTQPLRDHYRPVLSRLEKELEQARDTYKQNQQEEEKSNVLLKELQALGKKLLSEKENIHVKISGLQESVQSLKRIENNINSYSVKIKELQKELTTLGDVDYHPGQHEDIKTRYNNLIQIENKAGILEERCSKKKRVENDIDRLLKTINDKSAEKQNLQNEIKKLNFQIPKYEEARQQVDDCTDQYNRTQQQKIILEEKTVFLNKEIKRVKKEIGRGQKIHKEIEDLEHLLKNLTDCEFYLGKFRTDLAGRVRPLIAHRASSLLAMVTHSRYTRIELDEDYNIHVYDGNMPFTIDRYSGGEQDLVNLCLRIAISQVVAERSGGAPINFIVLDEIFGSQDIQRRDLILKALGDLCSQFRQIFIITHIEEVKEVLPVLLQVETPDDYGSSAQFI